MSDWLKPAPGEGAMLDRVWIGGPTASGKSAVALSVARELGGEIVTADSMQVYRGLDIGTAKPTPQERSAVPHHLLDEVEISQPFNVGTYLERARQALHEIRERNRLPVLCGGTGLYFQALLLGIGSGPEPDAALRQTLEQIPLARLLEELQAEDPETFARIDRQNPRRVIRAVEVLRMTGKGVLKHRAAWSRNPAAHPPPPFFVLRRCPEDLRERIDLRVDRMLAAGWVEETRQLLARGLGANRVALQAIGYRQIVEHLRGQRELEETRALIKQRTWQFARRQRNWFDRQLPTQPVEVPRHEAPEATAARLVARLAGSPSSLRPGAAQLA